MSNKRSVGSTYYTIIEWADNTLALFSTMGEHKKHFSVMDEADLKGLIARLQGAGKISSLYQMALADLQGRTLTGENK